MTAQLARNLSLEEMDKESMLHPFTSVSQHMEKGPHIVKGGKGVWVTDAQGNEYIDTMAGLACVNIGWGRDEVVDAMAAQARELAYYQTFHGMSNEPAIRLADRLLDLVPGDMARVAFGCSGSDANDTQVKLVRYYNNLRGRPEKKKIISRHGGYHGTTLAAASLTGLPVVHKAFDLPMADIRHTETPHHYQFAAPGQSEADYAADLAAKLEEMIVSEGPETVAAFIAEPVMGSCGMILPPEGYFAAIQEVLRRHDVLMIADEVICGFGRTGRMFGSERYGIEPDMVTIAKGLTSAYVPMSASLISNEIWKVIEGGSDEVGVFAHGVTYGAHPVCAAAALANLDIIEGEDLAGNSHTVGAHLFGRLHAAFDDHPLVGQIRGIGMIGGIELVADKASRERFDPARKVAAHGARIGLEEGLICRAMAAFGDTLAVSPPLVMTEAEADEMVDRLARVIDRLAGELESEGIWKAA